MRIATGDPWQCNYSMSLESRIAGRYCSLACSCCLCMHSWHLMYGVCLRQRVNDFIKCTWGNQGYLRLIYVCILYLSINFGINKLN